MRTTKISPRGLYDRNLQLSIIRIIGVNYHSGARAFSVFLAIYIRATRLRQSGTLGKLKISSVFIPAPDQLSRPNIFSSDRSNDSRIREFLFLPLRYKAPNSAVIIIRFSNLTTRQPTHHCFCVIIFFILHRVK